MDRDNESGMLTEEEWLFHMSKKEQDKFNEIFTNDKKGSSVTLNDRIFKENEDGINSK